MSQDFCVITNVDSFAGYAMAYRLLEEYGNRNDNVHHKLRLLCRNKEGLDKLTQLGGEVREVDYNNENNVRECVKNAKAVVLIPEHDRQRLQEGENVIKACKNEDVHHLCMISIVGVDRIQENVNGEFSHLRQYSQLEHKVRELMSDRWSIVRLSIASQFFYYMAPMIEERNVLRLPIKKDQKWCPVDMMDMLEAMVKMAKEGKSDNSNSNLGGLFSTSGLQRQGHKEIYEFTPRQVHKMEDLVKQIGQGLERDQVKYEQCSREETKKFLQQMRQDRRFKHRPEHGGKVTGATAASIATSGTFGHHDKPYVFPLGKYLTDECIETLCEIWELANQSRMDITSDDLKHLLNRDPQDMRSYCKNNRQQFRELR